MTPESDVRAIATRWLAMDQDPVTRAALQELLDADDDAPLLPLFSGRLPFGTAGLRAEVGPGPMRMNTLVIAQTAAGINAWLEQRLGGQAPASIVVGYDARTTSQSFAETAANVFAAAGHRVTMWDGPTATPLVAFALQQENADLGVVVTASHNPAPDNGFKVYLGGRLGGGSQLNTPDDAAIAAAITQVAAQTSKTGPREPEAKAQVEVRPVAEVIQRYCSAVVGAMKPRGGNLPFVYTAVHGVGEQPFKELLSDAGFSGMIPVAEQNTPDGTFPTAPRPNPEVPGVLDLAFATAERHGVNVVIGHDPDADRCAVALRQPDGQLRTLMGDELGMLLAGWLLETGRVTDGTLALSLVSHSALEALGSGHGLDTVRTLTGFKWIAAVPELAFGYEEAIGYCLYPNIVRDKDGLSAALGVVEAMHWLADQQKTLGDYLTELAERYGHTASAQKTVPLPAGTDATGMLSSIARVQQLAGMPVDLRQDLSAGSASLPPTTGVLLAADTTTDHGAEGVRVIARPSGTEPILKIYLHAWAPDAARCAQLLKDLQDEPLV